MGCLGQCHHSDMSDSQNNVKNNLQKHKKNIKNFGYETHLSFGVTN